MKLTLLTCLLIPALAIAQKQTSLVLYLPDHIQKEKLDITFYDGKSDKTIHVKSDSNVVVIRENYHASKVVLGMNYPSGDPFHPYYGIYYINVQPAEIRLQGSKDVFEKAVLKNVVDARPLGVDQMHAYTIKEMTAVYEAYKAMMASPQIDSLKDIATRKAMVHSEKEFEYIMRHADQYYAFHRFGQGFEQSAIRPVDTMIAIFNRIFPDRFKNSWEGKEIMQYMLIRKLREQEHVAPDFTAKDIHGNTVSLQQFRDRFVMINFWASWCVPCVKEFPDIHRITDSIPESKMVKIFISEDSDKDAFKRAVEKYDLKGIHLFADTGLITKYKAYAIPQVYLIDKEGKIVYDRDTMKDYQLTAFEKVVRKMIYSQ